MLKFHTNQIFIYPIKSVGPVIRNSIELTHKGLKNDRQWMIIQEDGSSITQREFPQLNKIICSENQLEFSLEVSKSGFHNITFNKKERFDEEILISLWGKQFTAYKTQKRLAEWFSDFLSRKVFIVTKPNREKALVNISGKSFLNFQDGSPIHVVNLKSVSDLSERCGFPINPLQFRANIYLDFAKAYVEDEILKININAINFKFIKSCERCIMINLKPQEHTFDKEPLRSLSKFRKTDHKITFGIYIASTDIQDEVLLKE